LKKQITIDFLKMIWKNQYSYISLGFKDVLPNPRKRKNCNEYILPENKLISEKKGFEEKGTEITSNEKYYGK